jgi:heptosyltransferase I
MTRTLVIQLGRLGDVIQTTPLFAELAATGDEVDVLVLRSAHEPLLGFPAVANIMTIPDSLKPLDDAIACGFPNGNNPAEAHDLLAALQLPRYDRIINASHAPLGCWLAGAIPCTNSSARSGGIIRDRECLYIGPASVYRVAMLQFREQNLFNLVDLLRAAHGTAPPIQRPCLYTNRSADLPFALPQGRRVALNPGASEAARCWPAENFARLAEALSAAGFVPMLVGAPSDRELCEKIKSIARVPISNFAGRTTIPEMATLLGRCELLISADTGAAHLAAAVGTSVVGLYGATAWFAETAPYGDNHLVLQTPLNSPMSTISLAAVLAAALNRLNLLSLNDLRRELRSQNQSAWESSIQSPSNASEGDPLGGISYQPIHAVPSTNADFTRSLRRAFAKEFLTSTATLETTHNETHNETCPEPEIDRSDMHIALNSLAGILNRMEIVAGPCANSVGNRPRPTEILAVAKELISAMEQLRASTNDPVWKPFSPIIHNLDWQLRMLPQQSPAQIFRAHADAYASAARILRRVARNEAKEVNDGSFENRTNDWKGSFTTGEKEGGQVPRSVRIQAPARQRGSVSP